MNKSRFYRAHPAIKISVIPHPATISTLIPHLLKCWALHFKLQWETMTSWQAITKCWNLFVCKNNFHLTFSVINMTGTFVSLFCQLPWVTNITASHIHEIVLITCNKKNLLFPATLIIAWNSIWCSVDKRMIKSKCVGLKRYLFSKWILTSQ